MPRIIPPPNTNSALLPASELLDLMGQLSRVPEVRRMNDKYYPWSKVKRRGPVSDQSPEKVWSCLKLIRRQQYRPLQLSASGKTKFYYWLPDSAQELLHRIDQGAAGSLESNTASPVSSLEAERFLVASLMEEAISSSILEGAVTTRREAKKMLREGRQPRDGSERMILNNYRAVRRIRELKDQPLTVQMLHELHGLVTEGTLHDAADAGRFQAPSERRVDVVDVRTGETVHTPPPAEEIPWRIEEVLRLANPTDKDEFMHPAVRAIMLHFAISYIHPYVDGNGRTARAVFYWSMLHQGYWLAEYLSISSIIRKGPIKYYLAFMNTETDEFDATYFILYHLKVIDRAITAFREYVERKRSELEATAKLLRQHPTLNDRQRALLAHALRNPNATYTFDSHANSNAVSYQTGRFDIMELVRMGFLERIDGRPVRFMPARDLQRKINDVG